MADVAPDAPATARLTDAIARLRIQNVRARINERTLLYAGGAVGLLGLLVVLLGWWGAAHTINLQEQVPYLISGGLLGLALVFLGGFAYFAYWVTRLVQEQRRQTDLLLDALQALRPAEAEVATPAETARLVATPKGTMAHRADCTVVAGKRNLRTVTAADSLEPCKLCNPYD